MLIRTFDPERCPKTPMPNPISIRVTIGCGELLSEPMVSRTATSR
jgi:hypothetical protein